MEEVPVGSMKRFGQLEQQSELIEVENRRQLRYDTRIASAHVFDERSSLIDDATVISIPNPPIALRPVEDFSSNVNGGSRKSSSWRRNHEKQLHQNDTPHSWLRRCWTLHFLFALLVLSIGILDNRHPVK
jgi:hypothetical protein